MEDAGAHILRQHCKDFPNTDESSIINNSIYRWNRIQGSVETTMDAVNNLVTAEPSKKKSRTSATRKISQPGDVEGRRGSITLFVEILAHTNFRASSRRAKKVRENKYLYYAHNEGARK